MIRSSLLKLELRRFDVKEPKFIFYIGNHYSGSSPREVAEELFKHKTVHIKGHLSDTFLSMITVSFVYSTVF